MSSRTRAVMDKMLRQTQRSFRLICAPTGRSSFVSCVLNRAGPLIYHRAGFSRDTLICERSGDLVSCPSRRSLSSYGDHDTTSMLCTIIYSAYETLCNLALESCALRDSCPRAIIYNSHRALKTAWSEGKFSKECHITCVDGMEFDF